MVLLGALLGVPRRYGWIHDLPRSGAVGARDRSSRFLGCRFSAGFGRNLPQVELSASNKVPVCTTPGRLMAFLESRNPNLDRAFRDDRRRLHAAWRKV